MRDSVEIRCRTVGITGVGGWETFKKADKNVFYFNCLFECQAVG